MHAYGEQRVSSREVLRSGGNRRYKDNGLVFLIGSSISLELKLPSQRLCQAQLIQRLPVVRKAEIQTDTLPIPCSGDALRARLAILRSYTGLKREPELAAAALSGCRFK